MEPRLYYYRESSGLEIDFIHSKGRSLLPIEVKAFSTFHTDFLKSLERFQLIAKDKVEASFLILGGGDNEAKIRNIQLMTIEEIGNYFKTA